MVQRYAIFLTFAREIVVFCYLFSFYPCRNKRFGDGAKMGIVLERKGIFRLEEVLVLRGIVANCYSTFRSSYIQEEQALLW